MDMITKATNINGEFVEINPNEISKYTHKDGATNVKLMDGRTENIKGEYELIESLTGTTYFMNRENIGGSELGAYALIIPLALVLTGIIVMAFHLY